MKKTAGNVRKNTSSSVWWILGGASVVTLYFNSKLQDPFNSPKMWILLFISSWLLGHLLTLQNWKILKNHFKVIFLVVIVFDCAYLFATLNTDNKYTAIFGETQRRNGLLTYLSLSVIFIACLVYIRVANIEKIFVCAMFCGTVLGIYGLMQYSGSDFIEWNNPYNSIISTLGNPNFAAAIMAIFATLAFGFSLSSRNRINSRIFSAVLTLVLFITIYLSNARQGLLSFAIGSGTIIIIKLYNRKKILGQLGLFFGLIIGVLSILGMLQTGPFEKFLYKGSVTIRGFYWRAGIKMFTDHPLTGVGIDRYGSYFKSVRESQYPLNYGYDITSTNAHNVFIQMFATGGIFVGLTYLLINLFIGYKAIKTLRKTSGENRLIFGTIFAAWLSFQAQTVVSIDNIGLSVWGWVLGGSILALSHDYLGLIPQTTTGLINGIKVLNPKRALISGGAALVSVALIVILYRGEVNSYNARAAFNPQDQSLKEISRALSTKVIQTPLVDPYYSLTSASYLISNGYVDEGMKELLKLNASDPRNLDILNTLAGYSEGLNDIPSAVKYRIKISEFDPWNAKNYLQLGINYKLQNDLINSEIMLKKVIQIAPNNPIAKQATEQLNKP